MTAPTSPLPAKLPRAEARERDLQARILQAEQRLIARQEHLRRRVGALGDRLRQAWQPQRLLGPALWAGVGAVALGWLWFGRAAPAAGAPAAPPERASAGGHWLHLLGPLWPLLPQSWRARVPPALVNLAVGVGLPLLESLLHRRPPAPLADVGPLELARLAGRWYEVARLPATRGAGQPRWQHTLHAGGVIELLQARAGPGGALHCARSVATAVPGSGGARLHVVDGASALRRLLFAGHEMAVLQLDAAGTELMLGSPGRDRLRLLSRQPQLAPGRLQALLEMARDRGYAIAQLQFVDRP